MKKYQLENENVLIEFLSYGGILTKMVNKKTNQNYLLAYEKEEDYLTNPYNQSVLLRCYDWSECRKNVSALLYQSSGRKSGVGYQ